MFCQYEKKRVGTGFESPSGRSCRHAIESTLTASDAVGSRDESGEKGSAQCAAVVMVNRRETW